MGGTSTTTQQTSSKTDPWAPAVPVATGLLGQIQGQMGNAGMTGTEGAALDALSANAQGGNQYAGGIGDLTSHLLNGGGADAQAGPLSAAFSNLQTRLSPYADGTMNDPSKNPALQGYLDTIRNDVSNSVNGMFAGAGRDLSGMNQQSLARGIAQGEAPVLLDAYNQAVGNQFNAANSLYGAANTTGGILSGLNQQGLANKQAGASMAPFALDAKNYGPQQQLMVEAMRRGLPLQNIGQLESLIVPMAQLGQQSSGTMQGSYTMSPAQQAWGWMNAGGNLFGKFYPNGLGNGGGK